MIFKGRTFLSKCYKIIRQFLPQTIIDSRVFEK